MTQAKPKGNITTDTNKIEQKTLTEEGTFHNNKTQYILSTEVLDRLNETRTKDTKAFVLWER